MKKLLSIALLLMTTCLCVQAYEWEDENGTIWIFSISYNNAVLNNNSSECCIRGTIPSELTIPSFVYVGNNAYPVTGIGTNAFNGCSSLTSINIPEGVTGIGFSAFRKCI